MVDSISVLEDEVRLTKGKLLDVLAARADGHNTFTAFERAPTLRDTVSRRLEESFTEDGPQPVRAVSPAIMSVSSRAQSHRGLKLAPGMTWQDMQALANVTVK